MSQPEGRPFVAEDYLQPGITLAEIREIKEGFDMFDFDGSGFIDPKKLRIAMHEQGFKAKQNTIYQMISDVDTDGSGNVNFEEFLELMTTRIADRDTKEDIAKVFRLYDSDNKGFISLKNLMKVANELGETMNEQELMEMIRRADTDGDTLIDFDDFYAIMTKRLYN
jgi:Ca2+-binding EF-hand superfamily protein